MRLKQRIVCHQSKKKKKKKTVDVVIYRLNTIPQNFSFLASLLDDNVSNIILVAEVRRALRWGAYLGQYKFLCFHLRTDLSIFALITVSKLSPDSLSRKLCQECKWNYFSCWTAQQWSKRVSLCKEHVILKLATKEPNENRRFLFLSRME